MDKSSGSLAAIVMAGGRGQRMGALCQERAKPALPFGGGKKVIDFVLSNCLDSQASSVAVLVDYQAASLDRHLTFWQKEHPGLNLVSLPPRSGSYRGTADAVYQNLDHVLGTRAENIWIGAGDHIYEMDYREMLRFHRESGADVTVATARVPRESAHRFGMVLTDSDGRVRQFVEKSSEPVSDLASMGIYVFKRDVLAKRLAEDAANPNSPHDFGYAVLPGMVRRDRVFSYPFQGYWQDIGTVDSYYQANMELLRLPRLSRFRGNWPFADSLQALLETEVQGGLVNSIIGPGCVIRGLVQNSIISEGVFVDEKTVVRDSIVMAGCRIGSHCLVSQHILDENVAVGDFSQLSPGIPGQNRPGVIGRGAFVSGKQALGAVGA